MKSEARHRALFTLFLLYAATTFCLTAFGLDLFLVQRTPLLLGLGICGLVLTRFFYRYGCDHFHFAELDESVSVIVQPTSEGTGDPILDQRIGQLRQLECGLFDLRQKETNDFDPWAIQEQRHKIRSLLKADPRLAEFTRDGLN